MIERARALLQDIYGYPAFRGLQEDVIAAALAGRDSLVLMPTGGGKSLCYQLPALVRAGTGLVVSPLIALMHDQVTALRQLGVRAELLNSSLPPSEQQRVLGALDAGKVDLVYIAPERLLQVRTLERLAGMTISLIAIDEAHCVSQWGHDFRQDYLALHGLREHFPGVPRMALTATADVTTREEIITRLALDDATRFVASFDRPNIRLLVQPKTDAGRQLRALLADHPDAAGIVYCGSRKKVDATADSLQRDGFDALPYHAGLDAKVRAHHQQRFLREQGVIIVATIAFGMGIDKPDVRFVAHLDLPKSLEAYYQEIGRAGRDGLPADAWMIYGLQDVARVRQMVDASEVDEDRKRIQRGKLDALLGWCEITTCRRGSLLEYFGEAQPGPCDNCDVCVAPPHTWNATVAAQKLLSCVYRTGQRFGAGHVIDVLLGKRTEKITAQGHDRLSTFGVGTDLAERQWRSVLRQVLVQRHLHADPERYGALRLTASSRPLLRGELPLILRADTGTRAAKRQRGEMAFVEATDQNLFGALRARRRRLADQQGVPPYVIFADTTLIEMATAKPRTLGALLELNGVGQKKLERYGDAFLETIAEHEYGIAE